ncbi:helix-turn-helix domain-containing protein [Mucilaginibacter sp.]|uniref:helix-turn-helix domain-containing protein n=1 Tax=Mucilaginibacter sp. TaxID=1882438 RepID=UPI002ED4F55E
MKNDISNYKFKDNLPIGFECISLAELYTKSRELMTTPHRTSFYHIIWFKKGGFNHSVDFYPIYIEDNSLLFLSKDIVQSFDASASMEGTAILFTETFFCQSEADAQFLKETILFNDLFSIPAFRLNDNIKVFNSLIGLIEEETSKPGDNYQSKILKTYLLTFLLSAERERRMYDFKEIKKGADLEYLLSFRHLLESGFHVNKQVNFYAGKLNLTDKRLSQSTFRVLGKTAKQMIDDRVMLEAMRLLAHTRDTVKSIGYQLGFEEPTNFIKYFRKHSHQTPAEFREKCIV